MHVRSVLVPAGALAILAIANLTPAFGAGAATPDTLYAGGKLTAGQSLVSQTGQQQLIMQADGNLALYSNGGSTWSTKTSGTGNYAILQTDGNLVVYSAGNTALWSSQSFASSTTLVVQTDGNLVEYSAGAAVWSTSTSADTLFVGGRLAAGHAVWSANRANEAVMQTDGNFVIYSHGSSIWQTETTGANSYATLQTDGNFVIYNASGVAQWSSGTRGTSNPRLIMQGDGNLVLYADSGAAAWDSNTTADTLAAPNTLTAGQSLVARGGQTTLSMQGDGNLVLVTSNTATWSSGTRGTGSYASMQSDGNFVVYSASGVAVWSTQTRGTGASRIIAQADGNLVVYSGGTAVWQSGTAHSTQLSGEITYGELEGYWIAAGGPRDQAATAAAIAGPESGSNPGAIQQGVSFCGSGSNRAGWGLWQITCGNSVPQFGVNYQMLDPWNNAEAAVAKFKAAGNSFSPWTTYNDGAYRSYLQSDVTAVFRGDPGQFSPRGGGPAGTPSGQGGSSQPGSTFGPRPPASI